MSAKDFWSLHPTELIWLIDAKKPPKMYGKMTEHEVRQIYEETYGDEEQETGLPEWLANVQ